MPAKYNLITILGPTAGGKTSVAVSLAHKIKSEIISADSRQVYRGMDIGTGKDIDDYTLNNKSIPYHLIDIVDAGYKYNVFEFQNDFLKAFKDISDRNKIPILCGGTGLYINAATQGYKIIKVPVNNELRQELQNKPIEELILILSEIKNLHNKSDFDTKKRVIRAIEIEKYYKNNSEIKFDYPKINSLFIGIKYDRNIRRKRISQRLQQRLDNGMVEEAKKLLESGLNKETLIYYGLEYKYLALYLSKELTYSEMFIRLETAIHQFAKRQMTWFRGMERKGIKIYWLDGYMPINEKIDTIVSLISQL